MAIGSIIPIYCYRFIRIDLARKISSSTAARYQQQQPRRVMSSKPTEESSDPHLAPGLLKVLQHNPKRLKRIKYLGKLFDAGGHEVRIAGGAVRDILGGKEPQDIDFATTALPEESLKILEKHQDRLRIFVTAAGQRHGTVAVKFKEGELDFKRIKLDHSESNDVDGNEEPVYDDESPYDITTLRCDKFTDGRHAEVEFINDWRKDAERRDLTINAMYLTLDDGKLIDYFNGESDLKNGVVRFVGDADSRIKEDYLRIMRYFRFWSRYSKGRQPDEETMSKIRQNLDGLNQISGERIWSELKKTLGHLPCYEVTKLMLDLRLFDYAGLKAEKDTLTDYNEYSKTVLDELKIVQDNISTYIETSLSQKLIANPDDIEVRRLREQFIVLLFAATVQSEELCLNAYTRLKFSNQERDMILYIIENRNKNPSVKSFKFQLAMASSPERPQMLQRIKAFCISRGKFDYISELESWQVPQFPVSGKFVSKAFNQRKLPGNKIKVAIEDLKFEWANSDYTLTMDELAELLSKKIDQMAGDLDNKNKQ